MDFCGARTYRTTLNIIYRRFTILEAWSDFCQGYITILNMRATLAWRAIPDIVLGARS
jgi:hypothetical protein